MAESWGLLIDWIGNDYAYQIITSAIDHCRTQGVSLVVFTTGRYGFGVDPAGFRQSLLPLLRSPDIDRLFVCSAQFSQADGSSLLDQALGELGDKPLVCLAGPVAGQTVAHARIEQAFDALLDHLAQAHGYRRFAWVGGPPANPESAQRERCLRAYLGRHGLELDESLVFHGDWGQQSGRDCGKLLAARRGDWDAIVAANDMMALGLQEALGPQSPLCGFDNSLLSEACGLTTVDPDLPGQVRNALTALAGMEAGKASLPVLRSIQTGSLVIRRSCGCSPGLAVPGRAANPAQINSERLFRFSESMIKCEDLQELETFLTQGLATESIDYWKIIAPGTAGLIPAEWRIGQPYCMIMHTLYHQDRIYGYLVHDLASQDYALSELMRMDISLLFRNWFRRIDSVKFQNSLKSEIERVNQRKQEMEKLINGLPLWILELDRHLVIRYLNQAAASLLGVPAAEARGAALRGFVDEADWEKILDSLRRKPQDGRLQACSFHLGAASRPGALVVAAIQPLSEAQQANLATLCGSLHFNGGYRLTGLDFEPLLESVFLPGPLFFRHYQFSKREKEIIELLSRGLDATDIAAELGLSESTVRVHLHSLYSKAGVHSRRDFMAILGDYLKLPGGKRRSETKTERACRAPSAGRTENRQN